MSSGTHFSEKLQMAEIKIDNALSGGITATDIESLKKRKKQFW